MGDLFTGRALKNIDLILGAIRELPEETRTALELCLTASIGQMSKMVFAITGAVRKMVKSRPGLKSAHGLLGFGVQSCTWRSMLGTVSSENSRATIRSKFTSRSCEEWLSAESPQPNSRFLNCDGHATTVLADLPDRSIDLILTDPPHSDRAPYLELSGLWNAVLGSSQTSPMRSWSPMQKNDKSTSTTTIRE